MTGNILDQSYVGYGGTISGDVHPFTGTPGALGKDDLGFGIGVGTQVGGQFANGPGLVTNFGRTLNVPGFGFVNPLTNAQWNTAELSHPAGLRPRWSESQSPQSANGWIWYQHWWTENLRSTLEASGAL